MLEGEVPIIDTVLFDNIDESAIAKSTLRTKGSAGPSSLDSDGCFPESYAQKKLIQAIMDTT